MGPVIGDLLPLAIGVALSPVPIIAVILMLFSKDARRTSLGFLLGWILGIAIAGTVVVFVMGPAQEASGGETSPLSAILRILLGLLFFFLAYRNWQKRPKPGEQAEMPEWMDQIDSMTAGKATGLGALLSGLNPKNLALIIAAGVLIAGAGLSTTEEVIVLLVFVVLASLSVAAPVVLNLAMGEKATDTLDDWKTWLIQNNAAVMMVLLIVFGFILLGKGLGAFIGG